MERERKPVPLTALIPPSFLFTFLSDKLKTKIISLFATAAHTIQLSPPPILAIYHYEMEQVFNLYDVTRIIDEYTRTHTPSANQQTDHLAWENRFLVLLL